MFDKLKKVFGFDVPEDNDELIADDPELKSSDVSPFTGTTAVSQTHLTASDADEVAVKIFDHVVEQFNQALPDFLKKSVDPEKEKKALYDSLSADLKAHLSGLEANVTAQLDETWRNEREKLQSDLKNISQTAKDIEAKRAELKSQQLSADRQKRAMQERIHDLEKRNLALEAEKDQLELEVKSMLNKVKVAQVYEKDIESMRERLNDMQNKLLDKETADGTRALKDEIEAKDNECASLREQVKELNASNVELENRINELSKFEKDYKNLSKKMDLVDEQLQQIDELNASKDAKISSLKAQLEKAGQQIAEQQGIIDRMKTQGVSPDEEVNHLKLELKTVENAPEEKEEIPTVNRNITIPDDDDLINDTDWIVKPVAKNNNKSSERNRSSKKNPPREDGQMSLW